MKNNWMVTSNEGIVYLHNIPESINRNKVIELATIEIDKVYGKEKSIKRLTDVEYYLNEEYYKKEAEMVEDGYNPEECGTLVINGNYINW